MRGVSDCAESNGSEQRAIERFQIDFAGHGHVAGNIGLKVFEQELNALGTISGQRPDRRTT